MPPATGTRQLACGYWSIDMVERFISNWIPAVMAGFFLTCQAVPAGAIEVPLRINAGGPAIGNPGDSSSWGEDSGFVTGGAPFRFGPEVDVSQVEDPAPARVYNTVRHGDHTYRIGGLAPGFYRVRLHFNDGIESFKRAMDYRVNGVLAINDLSILKKAGGINRAYIVDVITRVEEGKPLLIECLRNGGNDVFEAGIEVLATNLTEMTPAVSDSDEAITPKGSKAQQHAVELRGFAGAPARFVWLQARRGFRFTRRGDKVFLMGLDTEDGRGERRLLPDPGAYSMPVFAPDGEGIIYSDRSGGRCYHLRWEDGAPRSLGMGFASDSWQDPVTGIDWIYLRQGKGITADPIVRRRLDDPGVEEMVWDQTKNGQEHSPWFQISGDGKRFSDAFPWNRCGIGNLEKNEWKRYEKGCWPSIAPDNSYQSFVFSGNHRDIHFFERGGG